MNLYLTRHGETDWNRANKVLGRTDIPLNEKGVEQARKLALDLMSVPLDAIYMSPLCRAKETGQMIAKYQTSDCACIVEERLIEQNFGIYEGINRLDIEYQQEKRNYFKHYQGGESYFEVAFRVYSLLAEIMEKKRFENILFVTHGGICRVITNYFHDMENEEFASFAMRNCEIKRFEI